MFLKQNYNKTTHTSTFRIEYTTCFINGLGVLLVDDESRLSALLPPLSSTQLGGAAVGSSRRGSSGGPQNTKKSSLQMHETSKRTFKPVSITCKPICLIIVFFVAQINFTKLIYSVAATLFCCRAVTAGGYLAFEFSFTSDLRFPIFLSKLFNHKFLFFVADLFRHKLIS